MILQKQEKNCIDITSSFILENKVVIIPTDTVYGFSGLCTAEDELLNIKKRDKNKKLIYLIGQAYIALDYIDISFYSKSELNFLLSLWPSPLTIIFKSNLEGSIALRYPNDDWLNRLLSKLGTPIFSTSVNISGEPAMQEFEKIKNAFQKDVSLIVDAGDFKGISSTILDVSERPFRVVRHGSYLVNFDAILQEH